MGNSKEVELVMCKPLAFAGLALVRGDVLGRMVDEVMEATRPGLTVGNLVSLRRRGFLVEGPLPGQTEAETAAAKSERLELEARKAKEEADAEAERLRLEAEAETVRKVEAFESSALPEDFPGLAALKEAGVLTFGQLRVVESLTSIKGIGEATATEVMAAAKSAAAAAGLSVAE